MWIFFVFEPRNTSGSVDTETKEREAQCNLFRNCSHSDEEEEEEAALMNRVVKKRS